MAKEEYCIVGAGLIGMLTARLLAQAGASVAIYERQEVAQESTWAGGGILSPLYPWRYPDAVTRLAHWSQQHYEALAEVLRAETGIDPEYRRSGMLMLGVEDEERNEALQWARRFGYELEVLERRAVERLQPEIGGYGANALWMPKVAQMRNPRLAQALRNSLEQLGVSFHEHCSVEDILLESGTVQGIRADGTEIACSRVIVTGGAWSGEILKSVGIELPVSPVRGQMLLYKAEPGLLSRIILADDHYIIPRADGRILVGSTTEYVGFNKETTNEAMEELTHAALSIFPPLARYPLERQWSGLRPGTRDGVPFIGPCPGRVGLWVNAGHYRNGVVMGLASAHLLVEQLLGSETTLDAAPYALTTI